MSLVQYTHPLSKTQLLWKQLKSQGQNLKNLNSQSLVRHRPIRMFVRPYPIRKFVVIQVDTGSQQKELNFAYEYLVVFCLCMFPYCMVPFSFVRFYIVLLKEGGMS